MVKVYRPDGVAEEKDAVDARECVQHCGYSYEPHEPIVAGIERLPGDTDTGSRLLDYPGANEADTAGSVATAATAKKVRGKAVEEALGAEQIHDSSS